MKMDGEVWDIWKSFRGILGRVVVEVEIFEVEFVDLW